MNQDSDERDQLMEHLKLIQINKRLAELNEEEKRQLKVESTETQWKLSGTSTDILNSKIGITFKGTVIKDPIKFLSDIMDIEINGRKIPKKYI